MGGGMMRMGGRGMGGGVWCEWAVGVGGGESRT